jgi:DNA-binding protein H-NS
MDVNLNELSNEELIELRAELPAVIAKRHEEYLKLASLLAEAKPVSAPRAKRGPVAGKKVGMLFLNPETGKGWTGRGRRPAWVKEEMRLPHPALVGLNGLGASMAESHSSS